MYKSRYINTGFRVNYIIFKSLHKLIELKQSDKMIKEYLKKARKLVQGNKRGI